MNTTLLALNASYSHTSLAARYLRAACYEAGHPVALVEMTVNERSENISRAVFSERPDVLCCSVYIWNVRLMSDVCTRLKLMMPELYIVWGGPEVVGAEDVLQTNYPFVDVFCTGEGEAMLPLLLQDLARGVRGPTCLAAGAPLVMQALPDPYSEEADFDQNRLYYFETSRGCPYNCAYCISSREKGVRYLPEEVTWHRLEWLAQRVPLVKLVDRTFNSDRYRARRLWQRLIELPGDCRFHFEICAHLLCDEDFALLSQKAARRLQFEVGLQSTSAQALSAVNRTVDAQLVLENVRRLVELGTVEVHLDLIAGLPGEGHSDFLSSLERAMQTRPHRLHLGFLKVLPGTQMRAIADTYDMSYLPYAPYEVLSTRDMGTEELLQLKDLESAIESYYNSRRFEHAMRVLLDVLPAASLFSRLSDSLHTEADRKVFDIGLDSGLPEGLLRELVVLDFLLREPHRKPPAWIKPEYDEDAMLRELVYGQPDTLYKTLPHRAGVRPGIILRDLRLCEVSGECLRHLGLSTEKGLLLIDHSQPRSRRIFPVPD